MKKRKYNKSLSDVVWLPNNEFLNEFDKSISIREILNCLDESGHSTKFIKELNEGLKSSSVYGNH